MPQRHLLSRHHSSLTFICVYVFLSLFPCVSVFEYDPGITHVVGTLICLHTHIMEMCLPYWEKYIVPIFSF